MSSMPGRSRRLIESFREGGPPATVATLRWGITWRLRRGRNKLRRSARNTYRAESVVGKARPTMSAPPMSTVPDAAPASGMVVLDPAVTIVVTSSNRSELLQLALRSVQLQDFERWECIVVDDGSLDFSLSIAQAFAAVDSRFRIIKHAAAHGPSAARNTGLVAARAAYVCFLDDDDMLLSQSLSTRLLALAGQPGHVVGSYCDWINVQPDSELEALAGIRKPTVRGAISFGDLAHGAPFILSSPLVRADAVRAVGGFDESMGHAEDADLWCRLARQGFCFAYAASVGVAYRRSPGSIVLSSPTSQVRGLLDVLRRADQALDQAEIDPNFPLADRRPLSRVALERSFGPQVLRYAALIAVDDLPGAVELVRSELSPTFLRSVEIPSMAKVLTAYTTARLCRSSLADRGLVATVVGSLLEAVVPRTDSTVDWVDRMPEAPKGRRRTVGPAPCPIGSAVSHEIKGAVVLVPEALYHVDELGPLHDELLARGLKSRFMVAPQTADSAFVALGQYADRVLPFAPDLIGTSAAVVVMNDWGRLRPVVAAANEHGVPTFAKVEGVQDFDDVDTGRVRGAYRTASTVLGQGENDANALADRSLVVVGSSRLERIWNGPATEPGAHGLVNLNFTYNVLAGARDAWMASVESAFRAVQVPAIVSRHPAERAQSSALRTAEKPFRYEVTRAGLLVSRFSTVPFEAMARGVPFVYHNPHHEQVPTFKDPLDGFLITSTSEELAAAITVALGWRDDYRDRSEKFFRRQVDIDPGRPSEVRAADVICDHLS